MLVNLRKKYPNIILIPTADILYAELAHIFRTKEYYQDLDKTLQNPNPLKLDDGATKLFTASIKGTAQLWEKEYNCPYLPPGFTIQDWVYWKENQNRGMSDNSPYPDYVPPPSYVSVMGPPPPKNVPLDVHITLTETDLINDVKWLPELEIQLADMRKNCRGWGLYHWDDASVIQRLSCSYYRFLYLVKQHHSEAHKFTPPVSIDLLWHAHMTLTKTYYDDMIEMLGELLEHHPWKSSTELLPLSQDSALACLWKTLFTTNIEEDHIYADKKGWYY
jgi:hypothetical protein